MADQTSVSYIGRFTRSYIWDVERGQETLGTLQRMKRIYRDKEDLRVSLQEAITVLEQRQGIQKTVKELIAEMNEYQYFLDEVERKPRYYVAPDQVRDWYDQQIQRIRHQLRTNRSSDESSHQA